MSRKKLAYYRLEKALTPKKNGWARSVIVGKSSSSLVTSVYDFHPLHRHQVPLVASYRYQCGISLTRKPC